MRDFLNVYDRNMKKVAVLQNAYSITESQQLNQIYSLTFSMPFSDPKNELIRPFNFVRWTNDGELYRIVKNRQEDSETSTIEYECEHVIATLCDTTLFGSFTYGGADVRTEEVIKWLLDQQNTKLWELGDCEFDRKFEYAWEQENLLNALYAIPKEFVQPYRWDFDTSELPWKLHLRVIDSTIKPEYYIRARRNLVESSSDIDYTDICTKLYPLGYGEGVNQLTIREVNNDVPYLLAPQNVIDRYGIIEKVLVDRRYENAESLLAYGQTVLAALQEPKVSKTFDVADLYPLTNVDIDKAKVGKICRLTMDDTIVYITKTTRVLDDPGNLQIELSTNSTDIVSTIADLADRVRIESVYAQGATQLYQQSKDANASPEKGMILSLYFPSEMKQINKVLLNVELDSFRSYSQSTETDGQAATTTAVDGGVATTTGAGGGGYNTSTTNATFSGSLGTSQFYSPNIEGANQKVSTVTGPAQYSSGSMHTHIVTITNIAVTIPSSRLTHSHEIDLSKIGPHSHSVNLPNHTHDVSVPAHSHNLTIPGHTHNIRPGIFEFGSPSAFDIYINGEKRTSVNSTSIETDITQWLLDGSGLIPRNSWIRVEIRPNDLAYVISSVFVQGFVQSRGGGNY